MRRKSLKRIDETGEPAFLSSDAGRPVLSVRDYHFIRVPCPHRMGVYVLF